MGRDNTEGGKYFWNFHWEWDIPGTPGFFVPNQTSKRYTCDGDWRTGDPGAPCAFNFPLVNAGL
ncbi:MAG: hypothetical protein H0U16_07150 [Actinobacteria bacterium]|nr:hypothetical protein [Actinomycetota bacterium]